MSTRKEKSPPFAVSTPLKSASHQGLQLSVVAGGLLLFVVAFLAYYPALHGGFLLDDDLLLTKNKLVQAPDGLYRIWCTTEPSDYWPISYSTFWLEWRLWEMNPAGYHITNLALHVIECMLIWAILRKLAVPGAFLAAMLFAVHPVNVESVAWIASRKNLVAMLFFLLSIWWYLKAEMDFLPATNNSGQPEIEPAEGRQWKSFALWYGLSFAAFVLAMLGKGSVAVLPALLLLIVWWRRPLSWRDLLRTAPFIVVAVALAAVNVWFQTHDTQEIYRTASLAERFAVAGGTIWFYLYKAIFPLDLAFIYPMWKVRAGNPLWWLPLTAALAVTGVLWRYRRCWSRPYLFAWGFFCISLIPVMGFTGVGFMKYSLVADRYQHIAMIAIITLAAAGLAAWRERSKAGWRWVATFVAIALIASLAALTWRQSRLYRDALTSYQAALEKNPDSLLIRANLARALFDAGQGSESIEQFKEALRLNTGSDLERASIHNDFGIVLMQQGRFPEAIEQFEQALQLDPKLLGIRERLSRVYQAMGFNARAIEQHEQILKAIPGSSAAHDHFGQLLAQLGRRQEAMEQFKQALKLDPNNATAHNDLGAVLFQDNQFAEAIEQYRLALQCNPEYPEAYCNLGDAMFQADRPREAIECYRSAVKFKPDYLRAYFNLARSYAKNNQSEAALSTAAKARELALVQGDAVHARLIEKWLDSYRRRLSGRGE
jgi:protein O-mannosyl-transferase